jgi:hypothetical protein
MVDQLNISHGTPRTCVYVTNAMSERNNMQQERKENTKKEKKKDTHARIKFRSVASVSFPL